MAPVGPDAVGGAEQVLTQLDAGLVQAGHDSIVIACEGSSTKGLLASTPRWTAPFDQSKRQKAAASHRDATSNVLRRYPVDLIHLHGVDFYNYLPPSGIPVLVTLHLPPQWYPPQALQLNRLKTYFHCVSKSQSRACPAGLELLPPIENGVPENLMVGHHAKRGFAICLGRICPEKGFHLALDAAKRAEVPLLLAGEVFPYDAHQTYFDSEIVPRLDQQRRFIGPIGWRRKRRLLSAARCLLVPSLVAETSSLVAMEALACGTPVIAFPSGALPEIVEPGKTGFIVHTPDEMAAAIHDSKSISSDECRVVAHQRFSLQRMLDRYFALYEQLIQKGSSDRTYNDHQSTRTRDHPLAQC